MYNIFLITFYITQLTLYPVHQILFALVVDTDERHLLVVNLVQRLVQRFVVRNTLLEILHCLFFIHSLVIGAGYLYLLERNS